MKKSILEGLAVHLHPTSKEIITDKSLLNAEQKDREAADNKARSCLYKALPDEIYGSVDSYDTAKE
ncbi:hypothetical protein, partial [Escherichia coli]|uniref:hypothetical protein n=1 Tax=Escherichia coli TaxID=562 RepID=UPI0013B3EBF7